MQTCNKVFTLLVMVVLSNTAVTAAGIDLHRMWDDRCAVCHGHAAEFARKSLSVSGGELQGAHHVRDLRRFLGNHYLAASEVDAVYTMLLAQASNPPRFKDECSSCHDSAAEFARRDLEFRDGVLYGRESGRPVVDFLNDHRELEPGDAEFFAETLMRVAREVFRP